MNKEREDILYVKKIRIAEEWVLTKEKKTWDILKIRTNEASGEIRD